jgi:hypothetical protein
MELLNYPPRYVDERRLYGKEHDISNTLPKFDASDAMTMHDRRATFFKWRHVPTILHQYCPGVFDIPYLLH